MNGWYVAAGIALYLLIALPAASALGRYLKRRNG